MKKLLQTLSLSSLFIASAATAQNDTLLWADFESDPSLYIQNAVPPAVTTDTSWYNFDLDGLSDGSGTGRPLEWFWSYGFATVDTSNSVLASSSWTNTSSPTENWLITESVTLADTNGVLSWKSAPYQTPRYLDGYLVLASTTSNDFSAFTDTLFRAAEYVALNNTSAPNEFSSYTFTQGFVHGADSTYTEFDPNSDSSRLVGVLRPLSASLKQYSGQTIFIAFVHYSVDDNLLSLDEVLVKGTALVLSVNETVQKLGVNVFPNPATGNATVRFELKNTNEVTLNVFDLSGRTVYAETKTMSQGSHKMTLDLSSFAAGIYQVQVKSNEGTNTVKLEVRK